MGDLWSMSVLLFSLAPSPRHQIRGLVGSEFMKNILGIIVLSFLLSGCTTTVNTNSYAEFIERAKSEQYIFQARALRSSEITGKPFGINQGWKTAAKSNQEIANREALKDCGYSDCIIIMEGLNITPQAQQLMNSINNAEQVELVSIINKAKNNCKALGFKENTEKFTDCSLKLYAQEVDNNVALEVAKQKSSSSSSSGSMTIYDPVRDRQNQIDRGMKMLGGGCTIGIDC